MEEQVYSVSEVNAALREIIDGSLMPMWVSGEVGNLTIHRSGHVYLTLKDHDSQLRAVFFGGAEACTRLKIREGTQIEAFGKLGVYVGRGEYQLNIRSIRPCGLGALQMKFEELKQKLSAKGYFARERKKIIPGIPTRIGIVSSPSGAALKDFLKIALARFPGLRIKVYPAPVQGKGAEKKLADGVRFFNRTGGVDVIILMRGGGSLEDLWPFNEEILADAIFASRIPVISAVGHEIDFSISDFVADLRVPTPSGAAESLIPERMAIQDSLTSLKRRMGASAMLNCERASRRLESLRNSPALRQTGYLLLERMQQIDLLMKDAAAKLDHRFVQMQHRLDTTESQLNTLSPYQVLRRGYTLLLEEENGTPVTSVKQAPAGRVLTAVMADGKLRLRSEGEK